jgi:hypothetical protein
MIGSAPNKFLKTDKSSLSPSASASDLMATSTRLPSWDLAVRAVGIPESFFHLSTTYITLQLGDDCDALTRVF